MYFVSFCNHNKLPGKGFTANSSLKLLKGENHQSPFVVIVLHFPLLRKLIIDNDVAFPALTSW